MNENQSLEKGVEIETTEIKKDDEKRVTTNVVDLVKKHPSVFGESATEIEAVENLFYFLTSEIAIRVQEAKHLKPRSLNEVVVVLSADGFEDMEFLFAKQLSRDQRANRQQYLAMTEEEEKTRRHEVNVKDFAHLLRAEPLNVPDWKPGTKEDLKDRFIERFSDEENEWFIEWLNILYSKKLIPKEYS